MCATVLVRGKISLNYALLFASCSVSAIVQQVNSALSAIADELVSEERRRVWCACVRLLAPIRLDLTRVSLLMCSPIRSSPPINSLYRQQVAVVAQTFLATYESKYWLEHRTKSSVARAHTINFDSVMLTVTSVKVAHPKVAYST